MEFIQIRKNPEKEVSVVKINGVYHGVLAGQNDIYLTFDGFSSPLKASNTARSLKFIHMLRDSIHLKKYLINPR